MYYRVSDNFKLVSYKGFPCGFYRKPSYETFFINDKDTYLLLYRCDGCQSIDEAQLTERQKRGLDEFERLGIIEKLENPLEKPEIIEASFHSCVPRREVHWSITGECNYKCRHCFQSAPEGVLGSPSLEQLLDIIQQLKACGIHRVSLTGGEPLIRKDLFDIIDACLANEIMITTIYSNGALVTQQLLDGLKERGVKCGFQISFDGVGFHDWMRGIKGAENMAFRAMELLRRNDFSFSCAMCLCKENAGSLKETVLKLAEAGVIGMKVQKTMPQGEWMHETEHFLTNEETMAVYEDFIDWYAKTQPPIGVQLEGVCSLNPPKKGQSGCSAEILMESHIAKEALGVTPSCDMLLSSFFIGPNGGVTPCMSMCGAAIEAQFPNMFETPLKSILTDSSLIKLCRTTRAEILAANPQCCDCEYAVKCCGGSCRALAVGEKGTDYLCADEFACWFYKSGWYDRIKKAIDTRFEKSEHSAEGEGVHC